MKMEESHTKEATILIAERKKKKKVSLESIPDTF